RRPAIPRGRRISRARRSGLRGAGRRKRRRRCRPPGQASPPRGPPPPCRRRRAARLGPPAVTRRRPPCGHTFDDVTCAERRPHLCVPRANHAQAFFEEILVHTKGMWARQPFKLADWQRDEIIRPLFGMTLYDEQWQRWVRQDAAAW